MTKKTIKKVLILTLTLLFSTPLLINSKIVAMHPSVKIDYRSIIDIANLFQQYFDLSDNGIPPEILSEVKQNIINIIGEEIYKQIENTHLTAWYKYAAEIDKKYSEKLFSVKKEYDQALPDICKQLLYRKSSTELNDIKENLEEQIINLEKALP